MPRIAHIIVRLRTGGAEKSLLRLIEHTHAEYRHHVICFGEVTALGERIDAVADSVQVSYVDLHKGPLGLWQAHKLLTQERPALVQGWMYYGNALASLLVKALRRDTAAVKLAWNIRQSPEDYYAEKRRTRVSMQFARLPQLKPDLVIYNSFAGRASHAHLGYNRYRHTVIPNGIDTALYRPDAAGRAAQRQRLGVGDDTCAIGLVTRYHPLKGVDRFLEAAAILAKMQVTGNLPKPLIFVLAGTGQSEANVELAAKIKAANPANVMLLGLIDDMPSFLPALDLAVVASLREGTPNILLEAMSCGVPVVSTRVGDAPRILSRRGDEDRLAVPGDAQELAAKIAGLLDRLDELGDADRRWIEAHYRIDECIAKYRSTYAELLAA